MVDRDKKRLFPNNFRCNLSLRCRRGTAYDKDNNINYFRHLSLGWSTPCAVCGPALRIGLVRYIFPRRSLTQAFRARVRHYHRRDMWYDSYMYLVCFLSVECAKKTSDFFSCLIIQSLRHEVPFHVLSTVFLVNGNT